jgi:ABC-2 type transport system permease protein
MTRIRALLNKELLEVSRNRAALFPVVFVSLLSLLLPFLVAVVIPRLTGDPLSDDADLARLGQATARSSSLTPDGVVQLLLFERFLTLFLLTPITGAMAFASHSIVGEKQARTLEPLLATPITTAELLVAKVLGALVPTLLISLISLAAFIGMIGGLAEPGVLAGISNLQTWLLVAVVGPLLALVSLQLALIISSWANDARTAQQFGVLIILPLTAVLIAQFTGRFTLSASTLILAAFALVWVWLLLLVISIAVFDRETILTRWK